MHSADVSSIIIVVASIFLNYVTQFYTENYAEAMISRPTRQVDNAGFSSKKNVRQRDIFFILVNTSFYQFPLEYDI